MSSLREKLSRASHEWALYFLRHGATHFAKSGQERLLRRYLFDFEWLDIRLEYDDANALLSDFDYLSHNPAASQLSAAIRLSAHVLESEKAQLAPQLAGRLIGNAEPLIGKLLRQMRTATQRRGLYPLTQSLNGPGGELVRTLSFESTRTVAVNAGGSVAISGGLDGLSVWDLKAGLKIHQKIKAPMDSNTCANQVVLSHDGGIAAVEWGARAVVLDVAKGKHLAVFESADCIETIAISHDGRLVVTGGAEGSVQVWELAGRTLLRRFQHGIDNIWDSPGVTALAITPDGRYVLSAGGDYRIRLWDLHNGRCRRILSGHERSVVAIAVTRDGQRVISGGFDSDIRIWSLRTGRTIRVLRGHSGIVLALTFTADGRHAVSGANDSTVRLWELSRGQSIRTLRDPSFVKTVSMTADGACVLTGSEDGGLKMWDIVGSRAAALDERGQSWAIAIAFSPDRRRIILGASDGTIRLLKTSDGSTQREIPGKRTAMRGLIAMAVTPTWNRAVVGTYGGEMQLWELKNHRVVHTLKRSRAAVGSLAISADGGQAISCEYSGVLEFWDLDTRRKTHSLKGHSDAVFAIATTPDFHWAVTSSRDGSVQFWNLESKVSLGRLREPSTPPIIDRELALAMTPDAKWAFSAGDGGLKVWNLANRKVELSWKGSWALSCVSMTEDGKYGASGSNYGTIQVWNLATGSQLGRFEAEAKITSLGISSAAGIVTACDESGAIHYLSFSRD